MDLCTTSSSSPTGAETTLLPSAPGLGRTILTLELDQCRDLGDRAGPALEWARDRVRDELECCEWAGEITPSGGLLSGLGGEGEGVRELCAVLG